MSGVDFEGQSYRKGASDAIIEYVKSGGNIPFKLNRRWKA